MSLVKRFVAASLATLALSTLHAEPRCPGNVASLALYRIQDDLIDNAVCIETSGPLDSTVSGCFVIMHSRSQTDFPKSRGGD